MQCEGRYNLRTLRIDKLISSSTRRVEFYVISGGRCRPP